ncbi:MAG: cupin domain-containing protein [Myxococcales bacterium]
MGKVAPEASWVACLGYWLWMSLGGCATAPQVKAVQEPSAKLEEKMAEEPAVVAPSALAEATVIALSSLRSDTANYDWFDFRPGVKKLILSGTPESRHVSVLWYGAEGKPGAVPLHYHDKTESIFVIEGSQSDAKGTYGKGSFYFNPPGSGHNVFDSSGLFLLSYAAPPDFKRTEDIVPYESVKIGADYAQLPFVPCADGSLCYALPLVESGGMRSRLVKPQAGPLDLQANVLLILQGSCMVGDQALAADTLVVSKGVDPAAYRVAAGAPECMLMELAFQ